MTKRECFNCGATERLIYLQKENLFVCTTCYEFKLPKKEIKTKEVII